MAKNHLNDLYFDDKYADYEAQFNPLNSDRQARRSRKTKIRHTPKKSQGEIIAQLGENSSGDEGVTISTTYQPSRYEAEWLMAALEGFLQQEYITDVLAQVKGGKEASVYRCLAHPTTGYDLLAAKVYRPRKFRQLRNDAMYREGRQAITKESRQLMTAQGQTINSREEAMVRAMGKKTAFGLQVAHTSWLAYEYGTLQKLHSIGAAVPKPVSAGENAILMTYIGDDDMAAPPLSSVRLNGREARRLFEETLRNIEIMLANGLIHGDLSAYNILYWEGEITLIDFPQVTNSHANTQAYEILQRDIERVCAYFEHQGVETNPAGIMRDLWKRYVERPPEERAADLSRLWPEDAQ